MRITLKSYSDFFTSLSSTWRDAYSNAGNIVDTSIDSQTHFNTLCDMIERTYATLGGHPQYGTTFGHYGDSSGFLFRNIDLASIMLNYGWETNNSTIRDHARAGINDQIAVSGWGNWIRAANETYQYLVKAYNVDLKDGVNQSAWYNQIVAGANYNVANQPTGNDSFFIIPFMVEAYKLTNNSSYLNSAIAAGDNAWNLGQNNMVFTNGITDYAGDSNEYDRESALAALESYE